MKNKKSFTVLVVLFTFGFLLFVLGVGMANTAVSSRLEQSNLNVRLSPSKASYIQGEVIVLDVDITNNSSSDIFLQGADAESGYLKILISPNDQKFKQYSNTAWIQGNTKGMTIKVGQSIKSQATLLWNFSPIGRFANLSSFEESHIMSDYAFPKSGMYFIKATLNIPGKTPTIVESEPIQIAINEPIDDDLKVWNQIKNNGDIAYFIQQGATPTYQDAKAEKLLKEIEQITENYPNCALAGQMKRALEKFRIDEEKRREMLEKAKVKPKN